MSIQLKRTTSATSDVVLDPGQPGLLLRTNKSPRMKIGDGTTKWTSLSFVTPDIYIYSDNSLVGPDANYSVKSNNLLPLTNGAGSVGTSTNKFNSAYINTINATDIVPNTADSGELGYGSKRWLAIYSNTVNAHHYIVNSDLLPDNSRGANIGSQEKPFNSVSLYSIAGYYSKASASPFLNIFAHPTEADSDTNAYGTAVQFVTYYKPSGAVKVPHYLRFQAYSATSCALTFSRNGQTNDTISIGSTSTVFDNIYGKNILPGTSNTGSVGSSSNYFGSGYFGSVYNRSTTGNVRIPAFLSGTSAPASSTGNNGDVYIQYVA